MRMRRMRLLALASVVAFVILEVGCAGGGSGGITQTKPSGGGGGGQAGKGPDPFSPIAPMVQPRQAGAAARFMAGQLQGSYLITGGFSVVFNSVQASAFAEIFNPQTQAFTPVVNMTTPRAYHAAVGLSDGTVLVVGGIDNAGNVLSTAEIFDPARGIFRQVVGTLPVGVQLPTVIPFCAPASSNSFGTSSTPVDPTQPGGCPPGSGYIHVLVAGGFTDVGASIPTNKASIFDPATGVFNAINNLPAFVGAAAGAAVVQGTSPNTGLDLLIFGGVGQNGASVRTVQIYKLSQQNGTNKTLYNASWAQSATALTAARAYFTATPLANLPSAVSACNGSVVLAGGINYGPNLQVISALNSVEVYTPATTAGNVGSLTAVTATLNDARFEHTAALIEAASPGEAGWVLLTGGMTILNGGPQVLNDVNDAEFIQPAVSGSTCSPSNFTISSTGGPMVNPHAVHLLLPFLDGTGRMVVAGGADGTAVPSRRAELFTP